jgi:gamma-glutamylaminecyclotransferase
MCIIIVNPKGNEVPEDIVDSSLLINQDGYGITLIDSGRTYKTMSMEEARKWLLDEYNGRPYIFHARLTTAGKTNINMNHPYSIKDEYLLYQNGTIPILKFKDESDTSALARALSEVNGCPLKSRGVDAILSTYDCRFVITNGKEFKMYNKKDWHKRGGIHYSKDNVFGNELVFAYGTLKKGFSNHHTLKSSFVNGSKLICDAKTVESRVLVEDGGLPKMSSIVSKKRGLKVSGELYLVKDKLIMKDLDALEGHPKFYKREKIDVEMDNGMVVSAWCYMIGNEFEGKTPMSSYTSKRGLYSGGYGSNMGYKSHRTDKYVPLDYPSSQEEEGNYTSIAQFLEYEFRDYMEDDSFDFMNALPGDAVEHVAREFNMLPETIVEWYSSWCDDNFIHMSYDYSYLYNKYIIDRYKEETGDSGSEIDKIKFNKWKAENDVTLKLNKYDF